MHTKYIFAGIAGAALAMNHAAALADDPQPPLSYPNAPRSDTVDNYHGTKIADPFRPLEDPDAPAVREWIDAENKLTFGFLEKIPQRDALRKRLTELWDYEKFGTPSKEGANYVYSRNSGLQNQSVVYVAPSLDAEPRVLIDPNKLSKDGTVALSGMRFTNDGKLAAYGLAKAGSDWQEWRVLDVSTGKDKGDSLQWIKSSSAAWTKDGAGFFYSRFPEPSPGADLRQANFNHALYYHKLGTPQADDKLIYARPDHKEWMIHASVSDDGRYLVISISKSTDDRNMVVARDLSEPDSKLVELVGDFEAGFDFIDNDGTVLLFKSNQNAPRGRVLSIDFAGAARQWKEVVPQSAEALQGVSSVGGKLLARYLKDAHTQVKAFGFDGSAAGEIELPGLGTATGFDGKRRDGETFYAFTSFTAPTTIYRYDVAARKSEVFKRPKVAFDPDAFETKQVFYNSKDGTRIPMFISHKKGLRIDANTPAYLYGYGGFNIPITPAFSVSNLVWMEQGGIYAVANLRGGGEYGEDWHKAGTKLQKQNVFDDFISAAEWLIANKYTSSAKLAIEGRSNGGLLVGACLTQRPDLFGATLPGVGVLDMLRFHKFTIGYLWTDDYGSSDNEAEFRSLVKYSPLHNVKAGVCYPPTLITTADHDDRVVPAHSFKFAATLQQAQKCANPVLIRIDVKAGHGAGKPTSKIIDEAADKLAFLVETLKIKPSAH